MKAIITNKYGTTDVLLYENTDKPVIRDDEILVQVHACSVNPVDWKIRKGDTKWLTGRKPPKILGGDYSGTIAEIGRKVSDYKEGDNVWGMVNPFKGGTYAEYVKVKKEEICLKPQNLSFEEASSIPLVGLTAYQSLVYKGLIKKGDNVLINGCTGGVGFAGLQIAKAFGCKVTGVCSTSNIQQVKRIGVDEVIDYTNENVLDRIDNYDIFFDAVASTSFLSAKLTLKNNGIYITTIPSFQSMVLGPLVNMVSEKKAKIIFVKPSSMDLEILKEIVEKGDLLPVIEKVYPLEQVREAHTRSETGRVVGKLVLRVV